MYRIVRIFSPCKRAVVLAEDCGNRHNVLSHPRKLAHNQKPRVLFISLRNFLFRQTPQTGHFPVNVIRMGCSIAWNASPRLRPTRRIGRMGMYNTSNLRISLIQLQMRRCVGGRIVAAFHLISVQIHQHHIFRRQFIIVHTGGLNRKNTGFFVNFADISPCESNKSILRQKHIRFINAFL